MSVFNSPAQQQDCYITKQDIYTDDENPVLLLKQGYPIGNELLKKLSQYRVSGNQSLLEKYRSDGRYQLSGKVVVYTPKKSEFERLENYFRGAGIQQSNIHCVFRPQQLAWSIQKYQPTHVLADSSNLSVEFLKSLKGHPTLEQVILINDLPSSAASFLEKADKHYALKMIQRPFRHRDLMAAFWPETPDGDQERL